CCSVRSGPPRPVVFFYQAEGGIRDFHVTGVQTCALPISTFTKEIMLTLQNISYTLPDHSLLLDHVQFTVNSQQKVALIGNNGSGKSTLLKIIMGQLQPNEGEVMLHAAPYEVPQLFGQYN